MVTDEEDGKTGRSQEVDERPVPRLLVWHQTKQAVFNFFPALEVEKRQASKSNGSRFIAVNDEAFDGRFDSACHFYTFNHASKCSSHC